MTLDEAIKHARDKAQEQRYYAYYEKNPTMYRSCISCAEEHEQLAEWLEELKEYKRLEEQGLLAKLPCKVGDTVWVIDEYENDYDGYLFMATCGEYVIVAVEYAHRAGDFKSQLLEMVDESYDNFGVDVEIFHKDNVFLTKEEAEKELKKHV